MSALEPILQALEYVEANLQTVIQVADIANAAGYSLYHFCRMFGKLTRHSPYDYLIRRRMTLASDAVILSDRKLLEIALDYQFESHEGFTRAFTRMCGVTPTEARRRQSIPLQSRLPRLSAPHLVQLERQNGLMPVFENIHCVSAVTHSLAEIETELHAGQPVQLAISPVWPEVSCDPPGLFAGNAAGFTLFRVSGGSRDVSSPVGVDLRVDPGRTPRCAPTGIREEPIFPSSEDLRLVLDWILHVWLFYAGHELRAPSVLFMPTDNAFIQLWVPVI
jgi:AraC-like DNA-binding protein